MDKVYVYRKHLRQALTYLLSGIGIIISSIIISFVGLVLLDSNKVNVPLLLEICSFIFGAGILILLEVLIIYFIFLRKFKFIKVKLTDNEIIYYKNKKEIIIPYEDILELKFPSIRYTGGWVKVIYKGGAIRLTVVLENIGDFIYELKDKLDKRGKSSAYKDEKIFSFFKTATFSDEGWQRVYDNIKVYLITYYLNILITIILVSIKGNLENQVLVIISMFITIIGLIVGEFIIGIKIKKRVVDGELKLKPRDLDFEKKVIRTTSIYLTIGYIILVIFLTLFR